MPKDLTKDLRIKSSSPLKRVPSNRTMSLYLVSIKKLFNEAKKKYNRKEKNLILIAHSPFDDFTIPRQEATRKRAIPPDIIKAVAQDQAEKMIC